MAVSEGLGSDSMSPEVAVRVDGIRRIANSTRLVRGGPKGAVVGFSLALDGMWKE
jgi:hypothetical protein